MNFASAADSFSDVPRGHWAYDAVEQLAEKGIINGYADSTFRGDKTVTRYEMAQMIAQALKNVEAMEAGTVQVVRPQPTQPTQESTAPTTQLPATRSSNDQNLQAQINCRKHRKNHRLQHYPVQIVQCSTDSHRNSLKNCSR